MLIQRGIMKNLLDERDGESAPGLLLYLVCDLSRDIYCGEGGFREIGQWWEPKTGFEASEIDIVGIRNDNKSALVAEVKRQRRNYDHKAFMAKVERISHTTLAKYDIETRLLTIEDM